MSPSWKLKRKEVKIFQKTLQTLKNKYKKAKSALKEQFSKSIAPRQHLQLADLSFFLVMMIMIMMMIMMMMVAVLIMFLCQMS